MSTLRPALTVVLLSLTGTACQPEFPVERHVLGPFRLAAMAVVDGLARAAIWSGDGPTHAEAPVLAWTADGDPLGEGFGVAVPPGTGRLGLTVTGPAGQRIVGSVGVADCAAALSVSRATVPTDGALSLAARQDWPETPVADGADRADLGVRLRAASTGFPQGPALRWMVAGTAATVLEVEDDAADLLAERVVFDGGELESRSPTGPALHHGLVLALGGDGCNRWQWWDVPFVQDGPFLAVGASRLPVLDDSLTDAVAAAPVVEAELHILDGVPHVAGLAAAADTAPDEEGGLACGDGSADLDLAWMWSGRCTRAELDGARVRLVVSP